MTQPNINYTIHTYCVILNIYIRSKGNELSCIHNFISQELEKKEKNKIRIGKNKTSSTKEDLD